MDASEMIDKMGHLELSLVYAKEFMEMAHELEKMYGDPLFIHD